MAANQGVAQQGSSPLIRDAREADLPRINDIYNHYVLTSPVTFDFEPTTSEQRRDWFGRHSSAGPHRLFVADDGGSVLGYADSHQFRQKPAYDTTVETTVYCAPEAVGRGIGRLLYTALFDVLRGRDLRIAIAGITLPNDGSVALHERFGFALVGVMHEVGRKFDRYWDVAWYEKRLG